MNNFRELNFRVGLLAHEISENFALFGTISMNVSKAPQVLLPRWMFVSG